MGLREGSSCTMLTCSAPMPRARYFLVHGFGPGFREQGFGFILHTPERAYQFSAETEVERAEWTKEIQRILETPLLPQDNNLAVSLNKKRNDSIAFFNR